VLGMAVAICALGALSAPAFAKTPKEKKPVVFGKFVANVFGGTISATTPVEAKTKEGSVSAIALGPVEVEECEKEPTSKGNVTSESSETFFQEVTFSKCPVYALLGKGKNRVKLKYHIKFSLGMEFHSNRSVGVGGAEESLVHIDASSVAFKISKTSCTVVIPPQDVPIKAETKPEKEFESAEYSTVPVAVEPKKHNLEMFPSGFQDKLNVGFELKKMLSYLKPNEGCESEQPVINEPENPWDGYVEYKNGKIEAELEDITIKHGNLGFEPAA
jgi:hypothetical protein